MVRMYILDGTMMPDREAMHDHLYMSFALPGYYGRNLDALWDCLSEKEPGVIVIQHAEKADKDCLLSLIGLMTDLVRDDPAWELNISTGDPDCHAHVSVPEGACDGNCAACSEDCLGNANAVRKAEENAPEEPEETPEEDGVKEFFKKLFD